MPRYLIVNADDFGLSEGVNHGILRAHEHGILTSTSLMVRQPAAAAAAAATRSHPRLSFGLHVDLGEWVFHEGEWKLAYEVVPAQDGKAVEAEVTRQLEVFRRLLGRDPTHMDSHQHVHRNEPARSVLRRSAEQLGVPLRECGETVRFCGDFYGQTGEGEPFPEGISVDNLVAILRQIHAGWTELGCHPGDDSRLKSAYRDERRVEIQTLCDPRARAALADLGIELRSFAELP